MAKSKKAKPADGTWGAGRVEQRGEKWRIRWRENGERMSASGFATRAEALDELEAIQARLRLGQAGRPPRAEVITSSTPSGLRPIPSLVDDWIEHRRRHDKSTADEDRARWALHLAGPLSTQTLQSVTAKWVRELAAELVKPTAGQKAPDGSRKQPISGPTAHRCITLLSSFFTWAADEGLVTGNPAREALRHPDVKRLVRSKYDKDSRPYLASWAEVDRLYAAIREVDPTVAIYYLIGARAGLRPGEVLALRWSDIDLEGKIIRVERQVRSGKLGPTKGRKARTVPVGKTLARELSSWAEERVTGEDSLVCPPPRRLRKDGKLGKAFGQYLGPKSIVPAMRAAFEATGIEPADVYDYGRRTFGSIMGLDPNVSVWRLQELMGHANVATTQRYVALRERALAPAEVAALG